MKNQILPATILIMILILSGCQLANTPTLPMVAEYTAAPTFEEKEPEIITPIQETATPQPAETTKPTDSIQPAAVCPSPVEGSKLYLDEQNGFCLLYPEYLQLGVYREFSFDRVQFYQPAADTNAMEGVTVSLTIESNGPAKELTGNQYARKWLENFAPSSIPDTQDFMLAGHKGALFNLENANGIVEQNVLLVANEMKYRLILSPMPGTAPQLEADLQTVWKTVIESIVFFPPQSERKYITPEEVCPPEKAGFKQYIRLTEGYCLLYPSDFEPSADFPGEFTGGPVLEEDTAWGDVRASLTVGTAGYYPDQTIENILDARRELIDTSNLQKTTIAGCPAAIFRDPRGPWASRQALILREGFVYTLVNQPWEPERYPEGMPYLDSIWNSVTSSLAFFDPWR